MPRPAKLNDERVKTIVDAIKVGCSIRVACRAAGIGVTTFKTWMSRGKSKETDDAPYRAFRAAIKKARTHGEFHALMIIQEAMPDHWQAAAWFLERSRPARWGRVDRLKAILSAHRVDSIDLSKLSDEDLKAMIEGKANFVKDGKAYLL